jgi:hypothetical protein
MHLLISGSPIVQRTRKKCICTRAVLLIQYYTLIEAIGNDDRYATYKMQEVRGTCKQPNNHEKQRCPSDTKICQKSTNDQARLSFDRNRSLPIAPRQTPR